MRGKSLHLVEGPGSDRSKGTRLKRIGGPLWQHSERNPIDRDWIVICPSFGRRKVKRKHKRKQKLDEAPITRNLGLGPLAA